MKKIAANLSAIFSVVFLLSLPALATYQWVNGRVSASSSGSVTSNRDISGETFAQSDQTYTFEKPLINGYPIDVALKGEAGTDPAARQRGAQRFCLNQGYRKVVNHEYASAGFENEEPGTWQWDRNNQNWWFCASCGMYFKRITCSK